jgi:outer membrane protein TolC
MRRQAQVAAVAVLLALAPRAYAEPAQLSFAEAMRRAFARNPDALVAVEEITRARAVVEEVRAGSLPTLTATATLLQLDSARVSSTTGTVISPATQFNAAGTAALALDPRRWVQWSQARENVNVTRLGAAEIRRQLAISVGQTYLSVLAQRQLVQADQSAVNNAAAHVEFTKARLDGGNGTVLDFQRATALYQSDRTLLERAQFLLVRLQEQLGILLGENGPVDVTADVQLAATAALDEGAALDQAKRLRSDMHLTRERLAAAAKVRRESWADFMPSASASFDYFYQTPPTQTLPTSGWQLVVSVGVPIYDGGLRYGLLKERRSLEREASIRLDAELRLVSSDVRSALVEVQRARAALGSALEAAKVSADVVRLTTVSYRAGLSTNIEVIDAQLASLNADVAAALAENNERQAQLDLLLATGRFP